MATGCLPLRVPARSPPGAPRGVSRCCASARVTHVRTASSSSRMPTSPSRYATSAIAHQFVAGALADPEPRPPGRSARASEARVISARICCSIAARSPRCARVPPSHRAASRPPASNSGIDTFTPNTPPRCHVPSRSSARFRPPKTAGDGSRARRAASASSVRSFGGIAPARAVQRATSGASRSAASTGSAADRCVERVRRSRPNGVSRGSSAGQRRPGLGKRDGAQRDAPAGPLAAPVRRGAGRSASPRPRARACAGSRSAAQPRGRMRSCRLRARPCSATSRATAVAASARSVQRRASRPPRRRRSPLRQLETAPPDAEHRQRLLDLQELREAGPSAAVHHSRVRDTPVARAALAA